MPVTRTSSIPPRHRHVPPQNRALIIDPEVISLSSSEGESPRVKRKQAKAKAPVTAKQPKVAVPFDEVIEITDDDSSTALIADFRKQNNRLREESIKHKQDFERASRELREIKEKNRQLQALHKPDSGKITLDANVTEQLDCEICTNRMWTPYILCDCGHVFCLDCLQNWFGRAKREFMETNPMNNEQLLLNVSNIAFLMRKLVKNPHLAQQQRIINLFSHYMPAQPKYTCPICREAVRSRPTEVYILKTLARTLSNAAGEASPDQKKEASTRKGQATTTPGDVWDGFFASERK